MLKYGSLNTISNSNSKTLIPRNLTYSYNKNNNKSLNTNANTNSNLLINSAIINNLTTNNINFSGNLNIESNNASFINFDYNNSIIKFFYDINVNKITYDSNNKLEISSNDSSNLNSKLFLSKDNIKIYGPSYLSNNLSNVIIGSSLNITNKTSTLYDNFQTYNCVPISKIFVGSGISNTSGINFIFQNVFTTNESTEQFSGQLNITSRNTNKTLINIYKINLWTTPTNSIEYDSLLPINANNSGDWSIINIVLVDTNIIVMCEGSMLNKVIWGVKLEGLAI